MLAAFAEIGGAWLVWQGVREPRGAAWVGAGSVALDLYGLVATGQPSSELGRVLAAYGGIFVAGSLAWGMAVDRFEPDRFDLIGAAICLIGVAVIMYGRTAWMSTCLRRCRGTAPPARMQQMGLKVRLVDGTDERFP